MCPYLVIETFIDSKTRKITKPTIKVNEVPTDNKLDHVNDNRNDNQIQNLNVTKEKSNKGKQKKKRNIQEEDDENDLNNNNNKKDDGEILFNVLTCQTRSSYLYSFTDANLRPHMVVNQKEFDEYTENLGTSRGLMYNIHPFLIDQPVHIERIEKLWSIEGTKSNQQEIGFYFFPDTSLLFKKHFGNDTVTFDTDYWMETFDEANSGIDSGRRGFVDFADLGFGRNGVMESAVKTQERGPDNVCGKPTLIHHKSLDYTKLGNLPDKVQELIDDENIVLDRGRKLMNCKLRDANFAKYFERPLDAQNRDSRHSLLYAS